MKYKVGDKVKAKGDSYFNKGEVVEIIKIDEYCRSVPYFCEGKTTSAWQPERDLEPLDSTLTFQQKLDRFKSEPIGFLVKSKEIADELAKVFEREGMKVHTGNDIRESLLNAVENSRYYAGIAYVSYGAAPYNGSLSFGTSDFEGEEDKSRELLDITLEELKSYNDNTFEDKLALFKAGTHVLHTPTQEIYDKLMVELEKRGYVWAGMGEKPTKYNSYKLNGRETYIRYENSRLFGGGAKENYEKSIELTSEDFSTPQIIIITSDGCHRVTAESNGVTAEALCNPTDKFSIHKGSHMALKRLLEGSKEPKAEAKKQEFNIGDTVEVMTDYIGGVYRKAKGITGEVMDVHKHGCDVKLHNRAFGRNKRDTWGISKVNLMKHGVVKGKIPVCIPEITNEEPEGFHVGDIVEVLNVGRNGFLKKAVGLQGSIISITTGNLVEFSTDIDNDNKWWFGDKQLKLVRKYNA